MSKATNNDEMARPGEMITFHQVRGLIPDDQQLLTIEPGMKVKDALKLMKEHHYSQLPIIVGGAVLGVFSYRSFSERALTRQKANGDKWLGDLLVEDFIEEYEFVPGLQDWNRVMDYLNRDDAFFVGHPDGIEGLVTTTDVLNYFHKVANPFIILAEIELSLRNVIENFIPQDKWHEVLENSLKTAYPNNAIPIALEDMSFDNYVQIITNGDNWRYFEAIFDAGDNERKQATRKLQQLRDWRNVVFHFKRPLEPWELDTLGEHRAWLQRRVRASKAKRSEDTASKAAEKLRRGNLTREQLLEGSQPAARAFYIRLLDHAQENMRRFAVEWHEKSFSIRLRHGDKLIGFLYGYASGKLEMYFSYLPLLPDELKSLRRYLLGFVAFKESKHSLTAWPSETNVDALFDACVHLIHRLGEWQERQE